jgi:RecJ-like exonuclease
MKDAAAKAADRLKNAGHVQVVSHIDADGISAASIASSALDHEGIDHSVTFLKKLDTVAVESLEEGLVWFTDLGSGSLDILQDVNCIISDHHQPSGSVGSVRSGKRTLFDYGEEVDSDILQVNPHRFGMDGAQEISGAGTAYLVAKEFDEELISLAHLAIIGAVGDMQDRAHGRLVGFNRDILADGVKAGNVEFIEDLNLFGRETRPVWKMLQFANDLNIEGLTGDYRACLDFFMDLEINLKKGERWRGWVDLKRSEKRQFISALARLVPREEFIGEVYLFPHEQEGTPLHEAKEFATLLNSCGRYDSAKLGLDVCKGDRKESLDLALGLRDGHRKQLVESLTVMREVGVTEMDHIQHVNVGGMIRDTIIGTVAGMLLSSGDINEHKPIFAIADSEDGLKLSGRGTKVLVDRGLDLSEVMSAIVEKVGGVGGGHNIAAGATIDPAVVDKFLKLANEIVGSQLS